MDPSITEIVVAIVTALGLGGGGTVAYRRVRNGKENGTPSAMEVLRSQEVLLERLADSNEKLADTGSHMLTFMERVDSKLDTQREDHQRIIAQNEVSQSITQDIRARGGVIEAKVDSLRDKLKP